MRRVRVQCAQCAKHHQAHTRALCGLPSEPPARPPLPTPLPPHGQVGVHVSNIAQFFSYAMGNPVGFRSLALLSSASEIFGDVLETKNSGVLTGASLESNGVIDGEDIVPIGYNLLFLVINSYYILRWLVTRDALLNALEWDEDAENVYRDCFKPLGFRRAQFSRLVPHTRIEANEGLESRLLTVQVSE